MSAIRYLARIDAAGPEKARRAPEAPCDLPLVFQAGSLRIWASHPVVPIGDRGVICGHIFTRTMPSRRVEALSPLQVEQILTSQGTSIFDEFWGGYVVFLHISDLQCLIMRDPSGMLPLYWREWNGLMLCAPEIGTFPFRHCDGLRVDVDALTAHLWNVHYAGARTCLSGVSELLPGHELRVGPGNRSTRMVWSPWSHIPAPGHHREPSPNDLRDVVMDAVRTWGACFKSILVGISGGLDSSILCAAIDRSKTSVQGLNMAWPDAEGDERVPAQRLAQALGLGLDIFLYRSDCTDMTAPVAKAAARPFMAPYVQAIVQARDQLAKHKPVDAYFSGDGGDNVFCLMQSATPVVDRILTRSSPSKIWQTLKDVMSLTGADLPAVLRDTLSGLAKTRLKRGQAGDSSYLDGARLAHALGAVDCHPWLQAPPPGVLPGAAAHVRMLRRALGNDGFHSRRTHPPSISPLISQPIIEFCLGIASWDWIGGGVDRSVARAAFAEDLPSEIIHRRTKGGPSGFLNHLYWENEEAILAHLRSGFLAGAGIIAGIPVDGSARSLDPRAPRRLLGLAAAESWARLWEG